MIQLNYNQLKKMLRHSTRKTDFFTKHRLKLHISEVKQLLPPPPLFSMLFLENFSMISYCNQL